MDHNDLVYDRARKARERMTAELEELREWKRRSIGLFNAVLETYEMSDPESALYRDSCADVVDSLCDNAMAIAKFAGMPLITHRRPLDK